MDAMLANALNRMAAPANPPRVGKTAHDMNEAAHKAAQEFEAVFLTTMLEGMFTGLEAEAPYGGGSSEKTYRSLLVSEYAKQISNNGGLGLADQITRELIALQEGAQR